MRAAICIVPLLAIGGRATAEPCKPAEAPGIVDALKVIVEAGRDRSAVSQATLDANVRTLSDFVQQCDADDDVPDSQNVLGVFSADRLVHERVQALYQRTRLPVLGEVLGAGSAGVPLPPSFALGLSQVVTAGQPGMMLSGAGTACSTCDWAWRHLGLSAGLLVIQPVSVTDTATNSAVFRDPVIGTGELAFVFDTRAVANDILRDASVVPSGPNASRQAVHHILRELKHAPLASIDLNWIERVVTVADQSIFRHLVAANVDTQLERLSGNKWGVLNIAAKARVSPSPKFTPELSELIVYGGQLTYESPNVRPAGWALGASLNLQFSGSSFPVTLCPTGFPGSEVTTCTDASAFSFQGNLSVLIGLPAGTGLGAQVRLNGFVRHNARANVVVPETSGGFSVSVSIPVSNGVNLVGVYNSRWQVGHRGPIPTSGFAISKDF